ncbi:MAG: 50S ribosomal protein L1 [Candidatus Aenigmatarchaeota archaeon]
MNLDDAIKQIRIVENKKKFSQSIDLIINLTNADMKKPENKITKDVALPHGRGKEIKVGIISDSIKGSITKADIQNIETDKKAAKKFGRDCDYFVCEAALMAYVGKALGRYLSPAGKMPKPIMPGMDAKKMVDTLSKSVKIRTKDSPVIHCVIGTETMTDQQIKENAAKVIEEVKKALPGKVQIKNGYIKLSMGKPAKIDIR